jgi:hypothetical protein
VSEVPGWAKKVADSLGDGPHVVVSGISTSGNIHVGNLLEVLVAEAVANALRESGEEVRFIFHADTIDPLRKIAPGVPEEVIPTNSAAGTRATTIAGAGTAATAALVLVLSACNGDGDCLQTLAPS